MSNRDLPMMPWYPDQFASATSTWTFAERGAYRALLDVQWALGVLPLEEWRLARAVGMSREEFAGVWPVVSTKFKPCTGGQRNERLEEHRVRAFSLVQGRRNGAATTNAKRYGERSLSDTLSEGQATRPPVAERLAERPAERSHLSLSSGSKRDSPTPNPLSTPNLPLQLRTTPVAGTDAPASNGAAHAAEKRDPRASKRCPAEWHPDPVDQLKLKQECPGVDLERELAKMRDHTFGTRRSDWDATWRNWVREADERLGRGRGFNGLAGRSRQPPRPVLTGEQIESEIARGWRDANGTKIPGVHPDLGGASK